MLNVQAYLACENFFIVVFRKITNKNENFKCLIQ